MSTETTVVFESRWGEALLLAGACCWLMPGGVGFREGCHARANA
jgi:hypothetical protein